MSEHADDASQCSNGLTAGNYHAASPADRTIYRRWIRGMVVAYGALLLVAGVVAATHFQENELTRITALFGHPMTAAARLN